MGFHIRPNRRTVLRENGQSLVEFALTFSILMTFVFALIELCLAFYTKGMISESAREGTRYAIVRGSTCLNSSQVSCTTSVASIRSYVLGLGLPNLAGGSMTVTPSFPDINQNPGSRVKVDITYSFPIKLPLVPQHSLSLESYSVMYIIQ
jgi:Flp pilus assembly protein TadG